MSTRMALILCGVLSLVVLHTCVQIEAWNHLAGGTVLPNREGGKLRHALGESEAAWRLLRGRQTQDPSLAAGRPLTASEQQNFATHRDHAHRVNQVVFWSRGMGTLQYLLAPFALVWSVMLMARANSLAPRLLAGVFTLTNLIGVVSMIYRGYFND